METPQLTEAQMEAIAERAAEKAVAKMTGMVYESVGKTVIKKFFLIVGLMAVGLYAGARLAGWRLP